jgi:probable HAF family extracellular repeat protein
MAAVLFAVLVAAVVLAFLGTSTPPQPEFDILDLSNLGGRKTKVHGFNGRGQMVGEVTTEKGECHAFVWSASKGLTDLGTLGGAASRAFAINDAGQASGYSSMEDGTTQAFLWTQADGMVGLGTLGGKSSKALTVSWDGNVLGSSETGRERENHAFIRTARDGMVDLGTLGGHISDAKVMNGLGQIVGWSLPGDVQAGRAVMWSWKDGTGTIADLGTLGGPDSSAHCINERGQVVGIASLFKDVRHGFVWKSGEGMIDLGTMGGKQSCANAINNHGEVAGWSHLGNLASPEVFQDVVNALLGRPSFRKIQHAFLWRDGVMSDLNDTIEPESGWELIMASVLTDSTVILGEGRFDGETRTFMLEPRER